MQDIQHIETEEVKPKSLRRNPCNDPLNYIPDTNYLNHTPMKYIRLNFHFMNSSDSAHNFYGQAAKEYAEGLMHATQHSLKKNKKMHLPEGNTTPALPLRYRYVLSPKPGDPEDDGIYCHFDDELCFYVHKGKNRNIFDRRMIRKYGVQLDTVLNIFIMPHHPDSLDSPTYSKGGVGVALGNSMKAAGMFANYETKNKFWLYRSVFNHEVGHIYGLSHAWHRNDGCDDTPSHPNCWSQTDKAPCNTKTSNNLMDYNVYQHAWTPCQIGKMQYSMAREKTKQRKLMLPKWCELDEDKHIYIRDSIQWPCMKDLEGHLTIESGGALKIKCRVSIPKDGKITIKPGGKLILDNCRLHNACGDQWSGIEVQQAGKLKGEVIYIGKPVIEDVIHLIQGT